MNMDNKFENRIEEIIDQSNKKREELCVKTIKENMKSVPENNNVATEEKEISPPRDTNVLSKDIIALLTPSLRRQDPHHTEVKTRGRQDNGNIYEEQSFRRKQLQASGQAPDWMHTAGLLLMYQKGYLREAETPKDRYESIAKKLASFVDNKLPISKESMGYDTWNEAFFQMIWKGWVSLSTPALSNIGRLDSTAHGVACSGVSLEDSVESFYEKRKENALLAKHGYGGSWCLDNVSPRGTLQNSGVKATGVTMPMNGATQDMADVSQGSRRGSIGQYINVLHPDFREVVEKLNAENHGLNIGWNITNQFIEMFDRDYDLAQDIFATTLQTKMRTGKGYYLFLDKINRNRPQMYADRGHSVTFSNLCSEVLLFADQDHSFTCVLSAMNVSKYDEWKSTRAITIATVMLDCIIEDMLEKSRDKDYFDKVVRFTENTRAIGLGQMGLFTYLQKNNLIAGSVESMSVNYKVTDQLEKEAFQASEWLAKELGEPGYLKGYGHRFSHTLAFAPNKSTSLIMGGINEGINPYFANVFMQDTAGSSFMRVNPVLLDLMKDKGVYNKENLNAIISDNGSVQQVDWLNNHEKAVFRTAFETNQETLLTMNSERQKIMSRNGMGQSQSFNFFFQKEAPEKYIAALHKKAFLDPWCFSLYYAYSLTNPSEYLAEAVCEGCNG